MVNIINKNKKITLKPKKYYKSEKILSNQRYLFPCYPRSLKIQKKTEAIDDQRKMLVPVYNNIAIM